LYPEHPTAPQSENRFQFKRLIPPAARSGAIKPEDTKASIYHLTALLDQPNFVEFK